METKPTIPLHTPRAVHIPHNRRKQKRSLQHAGKSLFHHSLLQHPPNNTPPHANAHPTRKPPRTMATNDAGKNSKPWINPVRWVINLRNLRHSNATHERNPQSRKKKQKHGTCVFQNDQPESQRLPHNRPTAQ